MKFITSKDNPIYKRAFRLTRKKYRDEEGMYLLEGTKPLKDAVDMGIELITVFIREDIQTDCRFSDEKTVRLDRELFNRLSGTEHSQGIIAVAEKNRYSEDEFVRAAAKGNILVMDRLQDPGNIGTIIRTAEAAGYKGIMMISGSGDVYAPKVVRAAAGSLFRMPIINVRNVTDAVKLIGRMDKKIIVTSLEAKMNCFEADMSEDIALVIGNEGRGVSEGFINSSHMKVKIPMEGSIESLNAAVAAGILMYQSHKKI